MGPKGVPDTKTDRPTDRRSKHQLTNCSAPQEEGFKEVRRRKRRNTKKAAIPTSYTKRITKNFFAPLRTLNMDTDAPGTEYRAAEEPVPGKVSRLPPIILTSDINLIQLQKQLKGIAKQQFEFRSTRNGIRVTTKDMVDYKSVKGHFEANNLSYYTFYPKSERPIKAVIRHLPINIPAKYIAEELVDLGRGAGRPRF
jgi:hypothetical protein